MRQIVHDRLISFQTALEAEVPWMYLDIKSKVTVGIGYLLDDIEQAVKLGGFVNKSTNLPATPQEIRNEWMMVKSSNTAGQFRKLEAVTTLRLSSERSQQLAFQKANDNILFLKAQGHNWDSYPADGQLGLLSLAWVGLGHYPTCLAYVKKGNWFYAGGEATLPEVPKRQELQQRLLRNAGRVISRGLDPDIIWTDDPSNQGRAFFFKGDQYLSFAIKGERVDNGRPAPIDSQMNPSFDWPGFTNYGFGADIDAAVNFGDGRVFLFKGDQYLSYQIETNEIVRPPVPIDTGISPNTDWPGFAQVGFGQDIDAAINYGDGRIFFFKGDVYLTYNIAQNRITGPPAPIDSGINPATDWQGMAQGGFDHGIDAAINMGDGRILFFKGNNYTRYDIHPGTTREAGRIATGYPRPIWPTLSNEGFFIDISAAVDLG